MYGMYGNYKKTKGVCKVTREQAEYAAYLMRQIFLKLGAKTPEQKADFEYLLLKLRRLEYEVYFSNLYLIIADFRENYRGYLMDKRAGKDFGDRIFKMYDILSDLRADLR